MRAERRSQMPARGKSQNPDALFVQIPFLRATANRPKSARRVEQLIRLVIAHSETIFQNERRNPERIEPFRDVRAFLDVREMRITAARANENGSARRQFFRREKRRDRWNVQR